MNQSQGNGQRDPRDSTTKKRTAEIRSPEGDSNGRESLDNRKKALRANGLAEEKVNQAIPGHGIQTALYNVKVSCSLLSQIHLRTQISLVNLGT